MKNITLLERTAIMRANNIKLMEQNKRYREALNNIYELVEYDEYNNTLEQIVSEIEKALEV